MKYFKNNDIENALNKEYRQYLTGHLQRPQIHLQHIEDDIEIGISHYKEFTADTPHIHPIATEHGYVLEGALKVKILLSDDTEEKEFSAGDFFLIAPNTPYATKNKAGTKILFIKSPGVNDKQNVEYGDDTAQWLLQW